MTITIVISAYDADLVSPCRTAEMRLQCHCIAPSLQLHPSQRIVPTQHNMESACLLFPGRVLHGFPCGVLHSSSDKKGECSYMVHQTDQQQPTDQDLRVAVFMQQKYLCAFQMFHDLTQRMPNKFVRMVVQGHHLSLLKPVQRSKPPIVVHLQNTTAMSEGSSTQLLQMTIPMSVDCCCMQLQQQVRSH